jgi:transcriptional regulator
MNNTLPCYRNGRLSKSFGIMHIPNAFREQDIEKLLAFMRANSFATLVSISNNLPIASHIPLVVTVEDDTIKLIGHLAKSNPHWKALKTSESLAIFSGAHAYISPSLYEKHESVPTWNYIAVHAYGIPELVTFNESQEQMNQMIDKTIDTYESGYHSQWHSLSNEFREGMMNGIVGFEMTVTRLEGKYKLSQNRSQADRHNVAHTLINSTDPADRALGVEMMRSLENHK